MGRRKKQIELNEQEKEQLIEQVIEKKRIKALRNEITHKLRFIVLERDKFTCHYCGRNPKDYPGLSLEVDHIIPLSAGGTNDLGNLVTACWECNEGKKEQQLILPDKEFRLNKDKILALIETNDTNEWKSFLIEPENEDEREFLYEYNERTSHPFCRQNCKECVNSGKWYFVGCVEKLHSAVINYDKQYKNNITRIEGDTEEVPIQLRENNSQKEEETQIEKKNIVIVKNPGELEHTDDSKFSKALRVPFQDSKYNVLKCDFCYAALRCPKYKTGSNCAFNFSADSNGNFAFDDPATVLNILAKAQGERVMRGLYFEKIDGGALDKNVTNEILTLLGIIRDLGDMGNEKAEISIVAKGSGKEGTGVLSSLFREVLNKDSREVIPKKVTDAEEVEFKEDN